MFQQSYTYDGVNRLASAVETGPGSGWTQNYGYDAVCNHWVTPESYLGGYPSFVPQSSTVYNNNNQAVFILAGAGFDTGGNQTSLGGYSYQYDAENRVTWSLLNSSTTYVYDGEGHRVQKADAGGTTTEYVYDASGEAAAEYTIAGTFTAPPCATCYLMADHLGSTRMMTDSQLALDGSVHVWALHDYLPFGEELLAGTDGRSSLWGGSDPKVKFTAKNGMRKRASIGSGLGTSVRLKAGLPVRTPWQARSSTRSR